MTKKDIQQIMAIVRPAIIALYGRQLFTVSKYKDRLAYQGKPLKSVVLEVDGWVRDFATKEFVLEHTYRVEAENNRVTSLSIGTVDL